MKLVAFITPMLIKPAFKHHPCFIGQRFRLFNIRKPQHGIFPSLQNPNAFISGSQTAIFSYYAK